MDPHRLAEERSIAMHRAVADKIRRDPAIVERARRRVQAWVAERKIHPQYARQWQALLDLPRDQLCERLVANDEAMRALRQSTPFVGVLGARERWAIRRTVNA
jgi:hypothetical protein